MESLSSIFPPWDLIISEDIEIVGKRAGEKVDEDLISEKELPYTYVTDDYIMIRENKNNGYNKLKYPYNSSTAEVMTKNEMIRLIEDSE